MRGRKMWARVLALALAVCLCAVGCGEKSNGSHGNLSIVTPGESLYSSRPAEPTPTPEAPEPSLDPNLTVELRRFGASTYDVRVNSATSVAFAVEVESSADLPAGAVTVVDGNGSPVAVLNDSGVDGDSQAGDGIYTGTGELLQTQWQNMVYYATCNGVKSEGFEICFFEELSQEDYDDFTTILTRVGEFRDLSEARTFLTDTEGLEVCELADGVLSFRTPAGLTGVFDSHLSHDFKSPGGVGAPAEAAAPAELTQTRTGSGTSVAVIRPFRHNGFEYDDFVNTADHIAAATGGSVTVVDDGEADLAFMKTLDRYDVVLVDSHGTLSSVSNSAWDVFPTDPYLLTGEVYTAGEMWSSADWQAGRIVVVGTSIFTGAGYVAVGAKFFDKYYRANALDGEMFFLGTCYSLHNDKLANALLNKGAEVVYGYSEPVSVGYCNATLATTVTTQLVDAKATAQAAFDQTVATWGRTDPNNRDCKYLMRGNGSYVLPNNVGAQATGTILGKVCRASDRITPVSGAQILVSNENNTTLVTTAASDATGNYAIDLPAQRYYVEITADGFIPFYAFADVEEDSSVYMETFLMIAESATGQGSASGTITNALTGEGVGGVSLAMYPGWNNAGTGSPLFTTVTGTDGSWSIAYPVGNYTLRCAKDGFIGTSINIIIQEGATGDQNGSITPIVTGTNFRFVLTWGENPRDLDSHLYGYLSDGDSFEVYYQHKSQWDGGEEVCNLDVDDTTSYGPETTTLDASGSRPYYYYIYKYAGSGSLSTSGAQIKVYQGAELLATFNVPTDQGEGRYWNVFAIVNGELVVRNTVTSREDVSYAG